MKEMRIKGRMLRFVDEGEGFPLLLGHSFLFDSEMWRPQIDELKKSYRVIATDLWAHGQSEPAPEENISVYDIADDMWRLMQGLGFDRFAVLGLSIGGMWGVKLALDHPNSVAALAIFGSHVGAEPPARRVEYDAMFTNLKSLGRFTDEFANSLTPYFFCPHTFATKPALPNRLKAALMAMRPENIQSIIKMGHAIFAREDLRGQLKNITCPSLVAVGHEDIARPPSESKEMASLLPKSEYHEVSNASHIMTLEQPQEVNAIITDFLRRALKS